MLLVIGTEKFFNIIYEKYKENSNFYFIVDSIKNQSLTKNLDKKCIAITHHGNVTLEMSYLGFKVISSQASFCSKKFQISNIWNGRAEYSKQLYKKHRQA